MEIYGYHPILKKRVEIGNSGIFRPEMLAPMVIYFINYIFYKIKI
jgi:phenylalanyl-tRNA synthetase alpha chain